jgi:hypothetical protein
MMKMGSNAANDDYTLRCKAEGIKIHPSRFPAQLPKFFIKMLTEPCDLVVDPFIFLSLRIRRHRFRVCNILALTIG